MDRRVFLWLQARNATARPYVDSIDVTIGSDMSMFNTFVREALVRCGAVSLSEDLQMDHPSSAWSAELAPRFGNKILGGVLLRFVYNVDVMTVMSRLERSLRSFWMSTRWGEDLMVSCKIDAVFRFDVPQEGTVLKLMQAQRAFFCQLAPFTVTRLLEQRAGDGTAYDHLQRWAHEFHNGRPFDSLNVRISSPMPHMLLIAFAEWREYILPVPKTRLGLMGTGYNYVPDLLPAHIFQQGFRFPVFEGKAH